MRVVPTYCTVYGTWPATRAMLVSQARSPTYLVKSSSAYGWSTAKAASATPAASAALYAVGSSRPMGLPNST